MDMKQQIKSWAETTYGEMLDSRMTNRRYRQGPEVEMARNVLRMQDLTDKQMDGNSTSGLDKMEKEVGQFQYVKVFNAISKAHDWSPMDMVYGTCFLAMRDRAVCIKAREWGMSEEELISKMCGRALRALPSYLREHDLKLQLERRMPDAEFVQNEAVDTKLHADIMMRRDGEEYYFWSFVNTPRSIENFKDKFFGHRQGHIPDGYHVTCPFSLECCDDFNGWKLYDNLSVGAIVRMIDHPTHSSYENVEEKSNRQMSYFQSPKLIVKNDDRELEMCNDYEMTR